MNRKAVSGMMVTLLLVGTLLLAFSIHPVKADWTWTETIYIRSDGSVNPDTAPISTVDNITYTLTDNIVGAAPSYYDTAVIIERNNIVLNGADYTLQGTDVFGSKGIGLHGRSNVTVKNVNIRNFYFYGVYLSGSFNNTVSGNTMTNNRYGVELVGSSNNTVSGNTITNNNMYGVYLGYSSSNSISGNNITANKYDGILLSYSSSNSISGNNIANNDYGIYLGSSSNISISGNVLSGNKYNLGVFGDLQSHYHSIDTSNLVDGKPIYYLVNHKDLVISPVTHTQVGYLALVNCNNITVEDLTLTNNGQGILVFNTNNSMMSGNNIANNGYGIWLRSSSNISISGNNITNNYRGIYVWHSFNNIIYHNNFIDNSQQVEDPYTYSINVWDDGYPSGGNYWSDYEGRYPDAIELDGSGIWDTPYFIDGNNQDNFPLMEPWTPSPPIPTTIGELETKIEELGSEGEITNQGIVTSLIAKLNVAQKLLNSGKIDQAKNILNAFINEVQAQSGKHITPDARDILIESAEYILSHL